MDVWDLFAEGHLAKPSQLRDCARALKTPVETSPLSTCGQSTPSSPSGSFGNKSPAFSLPAETPLAVSWLDLLATIPQSSRLAESGEIVGFSLQRTKEATRSLGAYFALNISECPNDAVESSLSDILESDAGGSLSKYYLSDTAKTGILRRAEKRGKKLPKMLEEALRQ